MPQHKDDCPIRKACVRTYCECLSVLEALFGSSEAWYPLRSTSSTDDTYLEDTSTGPLEPPTRLYGVNALLRCLTTEVGLGCTFPAKHPSQRNSITEDI